MDGAICWIGTYFERYIILYHLEIDVLLSNHSIKRLEIRFVGYKSRILARKLLFAGLKFIT